MTRQRPPVVGRQRERTTLRELVAAASSGSGGTLVLEGEAGTGKSTLVDELCDQHRCTVLRGAARELERERPFGCVVEALTAASHDLRFVVSGVDAQAQAGDDARFLVVDELVDRVEQACQVAPVLLVLEDLHWSDPSSTLVLARLARIAPTLPLAVVATLRPAPRPPHLSLALAAALDAGATTHRLQPLTAQDVDELARRALHRKPTDGELARVGEAGGNPLFVVELLRAFATDPVGDAGAASLPPSLRLTLLRRVSALPGPAVETLRIASVLGSEFSVTDLSLLLGRSLAEVVTQLLPAVDDGLLLDVGPHRLRFSHDLVREAVYEDVPTALRSALHGQAARLLAQAGARPLDVAQHVALGAVPGDPGAVDLLERALEIVDPLSGRDAQVEAQLALALRVAGRTASAAERARAALSSTTLPAAQRCALVQLVCEAMLDRADDLVALAERALRDPTTSRGERSIYAGYLWFIRVAWRGEDGDAVDPDVRDAMADGDDLVRCYAAFGQALQCLVAVDLDRAMQHLHIALDLAERNRLWREAVQLRSQRGFVLALQDRVDESLEEAARARRLALRINPRNASMVTLMPLFWAGAWEDLLTELDVRREMALEGGWDVGGTDFAFRAHILFRAGDPDGVRHLEAAERVFAARGPHGAVHLALWTRALVEARDQGPAAGLTALRSALAARPKDALFARLVVPDAVRLAVQAGDAESAADLTAHLEDAASRFGSPSSRAAALHARALATADDAALDESLQLYAETPARPDERAAAMVDAARRWRRSQRERSDHLLVDAVSLLRRIGAHGDAARCARDLAPVRREHRPVTGWASLTDSERRVAELVAKGLRNKQIAAELYVSPRTVETHVSRALGKLQVDSRVELAALAYASARGSA